ncbi:acid-sensing ion channel 1-like [Haliotis rufescens]|uniref:acid-sensing ion channel 1-like n=1 Tax=Haliotis rufescens TaxID=6454 RepID=UPI00201F8EBA|nr:acid-sensing ion channel 1-like [Haliotis rufescens]
MSAKVASSDRGVGLTDKSSSSDNIGSLWTDFTQNAGFHGINKLTPGHNYRLRCVTWTVAVLVMSAYMSYSVTKELMNYYRYPVITNTKVEVLEELPFPAVTFCNQSPFNLSKVRAADPHLETYFNKVSLLGPFTGPLNWSEPGFDRPIYRESQTLDWWKNIHMSPEEMLYMCMMNSVPYWPCWSSMKPVFTTLGYCSTFNWNASDVTNVRVTGSENNLLLYVKVDQSNYALGHQLSSGIKVILHDPRIHPDVAGTSFLAAPGSTTNAVVQRSTYQYLPPPYQAFKNRTCVDTLAPSFNNTLQYFDTYTYENCLRECMTKITYNICGCIAFADNGTIGQYCSIYNLTNCYNPVYGFVMRNATIRKSCACQLPCSFATYDVKVSASKYPSDVSVNMLLYLKIAPDEEYVRENYLEIRIFYENLLVHSTEQTPQYTTETIIGNLGGQMGICLGASILTLTELGEFLLILCVTLFRRCKHGGEVKHIKPTQH